MSFPIISPVFYKELTDSSKEENDGVKYNVTISPEAVEYSFPLYQEKVVRKLMEMKEIIPFSRQESNPETIKKYLVRRDELVEKYPQLEHYWQGRVVMMNAIQDRGYSIEKRMLIMNFMCKSMQNAIDNARGNELQPFINGFLQSPDRSKIMDFFKTLKPNFLFSVMDALSMLRGMPSTPEFDEVRKTVFDRLGYPEDEKEAENYSFEKHLPEYLNMKKYFFADYLRQGEEDSKEYYLENVMMNYIWTFTMPFADYRLSLWENFVFYNVIFNTVKVMLTCYITAENGDEGFVKAITAFDSSVQEIDGSMADVTFRAVEARGFDTNGDMAILSMS